MKFEPEDHWVNNQLISPINKVEAFYKAIADAEKATEQRIIKLLDSSESITEIFEWFVQHIPHTEPLSEIAVEDLSERLIALIKGEGENK